MFYAHARLDTSKVTSERFVPSFVQSNLPICKTYLFRIGARDSGETQESSKAGMGKMLMRFVYGRSRSRGPPGARSYFLFGCWSWHGSDVDVDVDLCSLLLVDVLRAI